MIPGWLINIFCLFVIVILAIGVWIVTEAERNATIQFQPPRNYGPPL